MVSVKINVVARESNATALSHGNILKPKQSKSLKAIVGGGYLLSAEGETFMDVKRIAEKKSGKGVALATRLLFFAAVAALASRAVLPFGAVPFGFAALCAVSGIDVLGALVGVTVGLAGQSTPWVFLGAYAITLIVRAVFSLTEERETPIFGEHLSLRAVAAATGCFALGLYRLLSGGFLYYYLWGTVISIALSAAAAVLWYFVADQGAAQKESRGYEIARSAAVVLFACASVWGLRGVTFYGISLSVFLCSFITLLATRKWGMGLGTVTGALSGLCVSVSYAPLFAFGAVSFGLIYSVSPLPAAISAFAVGMAWGFYIEGASAIGIILPALMASCFLFYAYDKLYLKAEPPHEDCTEEKTDCAVRPTDVALLRLDRTARRIKLLCQGFSSLSQMLSSRSDTDRYTFDSKLFAEIGELGGDSDISGYTGYMCEMLQNELPTLEWGDVADCLAGVMRDVGADIDVELSRSISQRLSSLCPNCGLRAVAFSENDRRITVLCDKEEILRRRSEEICRELEGECGYPLRYGDIENFEGQAYLSFYPQPLLDISFSGRKKNAVGEAEFCGDSFGVIMKKDESKVFSFISDGMGSGREAAVTSGLCALFLQKLLPVGCGEDHPVDVTLNMLNGFLRSRNGISECSSTVDLCLLDLVRCRAQFYKCGASPTYIFRDGALFKLRSRTVPIGIVEDVDIGRIDMELCPGDTVVMVSDGVTQGREECPELFEHLRSRILTHSAEQLADSVVDFATEQGSIDDISVVVIKIDAKVA